jgi:hypothetical protein
MLGTLGSGHCQWSSSAAVTIVSSERRKKSNRRKKVGENERRGEGRNGNPNISHVSWLMNLTGRDT